MGHSNQVKLTGEDKYNQLVGQQGWSPLEAANYTGYYPASVCAPHRNCNGYESEITGRYYSPEERYEQYQEQHETEINNRLSVLMGGERENNRISMEKFDAQRESQVEQWRNQWEQQQGQNGRYNIKISKVDYPALPSGEEEYDSNGYDEVPMLEARYDHGEQELNFNTQERVPVLSQVWNFLTGK
jgi:hypothetical protein